MSKHLMGYSRDTLDVLQAEILEVLPIVRRNTFDYYIDL